MAEDVQTGGYNGGDNGGAAPPFDPIEMIKPWANILVLIGLLLVLVARGCGTMAQYSAQAKAGEADIADAEFKFDQETAVLAIEENIQAEQDADDPDQEQITKLREDLSKLRKEQTEAYREFKNDELRELQLEARTAREKVASSRWWHEVWFLLGAILLTAGLITIGFTREGPERMVALIIIAIIALYLFGGGGGIPVRAVN